MTDGGSRAVPEGIRRGCGGSTRVRVIQRVSGTTLRQCPREAAGAGFRIIAGDWPDDCGAGRNLASGHRTVWHSGDEGTPGDVPTRTAKSFFAPLRCGNLRAFRSASRHHLHGYATAFEFRGNYRTVRDHEHMRVAIAQSGVTCRIEKPAAGAA